LDAWILTGLLSAALCAPLAAQEPYKKPVSVGEPPADHSPAAELATFQVLEGFEVNLFADESDGIANALVIRWDEKGRLWCLQTSAYPQPAPDEPADDKVIILEDTDGDGRADKSTVWASGLRMPMGMELAGPGQLYVGEGEKLLLLTDTDGDDRADRREVVFSGFGTGDTHQNLNSFVWAPEGCLVMHQGLHCYSRVVTPHGVVQLYGAGFWRYWPRSQRLEAYPTGMPLNPWGTAFTREGQPIMVAGAAGMFWARPMEIAVPEVPPEQAGGTGTTAGLPYFLFTRHMLPHSGQIIKTSGLRKFCGVDIPWSDHWPNSMADEIVTGGFFENAIYRHKLRDDPEAPSGFEAVEQTPLITSSSVAFRPVDVRFGPDGALYIADWYNPIIGHYQASFRHPNRDKQHGRIWRMAAKGRALTAQNDALGEMTDKELVSAMLHQNLRFPNETQTDRWKQYQAQRLVMAKLRGRELQLDDALSYSNSQIQGRFGWEEARILQWQLRQFEERPSIEGFLDAFRNQVMENDRALTVHALGNWAQELPEALNYLDGYVRDFRPRVRLEAIVACAKLKSADALRVALKALDSPMDTFLDRALWLAVHATAPEWKKPGTLQPFLASLPPAHLSYVMEKDGSRELIETARGMLTRGADTLPGPTRLALHRILIRKGGVEDQMRALRAGMEDIAVLTELKLTLGAQAKAPAPEGALPLILELLAADSEHRRSAACALAAVWRLQTAAPAIRDIAAGVTTKSLPVRAAAIEALSRLGEAPESFQQWLNDTRELWPVRVAALTALAQVKPVLAGNSAAALLDGLAAHDEASLRAALTPLLARPRWLARGPATQALAKALEARPCSKETAAAAQAVLAATGQSDAALTAALGKILGVKNTQPAYDPAWVEALAAEVKAAGDAEKGRAVFQNPLFGCTACHQIGGQGGIIGPELDAVGRGVPLELLIEAVVWPGRQIKEGYVAANVTMKDGRRLQGYKFSEGGGELQLKELGTGTLLRLALKDIQEHQESGSLMPEGLIVNMTREELRDLVAYLAALGR